MLRSGQLLFTYLHLAPDPEQTKGLLESGCTAIAYETVTERPRRPAPARADERGRRPHVRAGRRPLPGEGARRLAASCSAACPACRRGKVVILGGGVVRHPRRPHGHGPRGPRHRASTDRSTASSSSTNMFGSKLYTQYATVDAIEQHVIGADLVIGAVLVPGAAAPKLVTKRDAEEDAARLGARRHLHRPGRLLRDQPRHDARRSRPTSSTASSTTASPTCRAQWRAPPPTPSTTPPCPSR